VGDEGRRGRGREMIGEGKEGEMKLGRVWMKRSRKNIWWREQ
jgi:hypothetical protein